jgi:hypothetical protein
MYKDKTMVNFIMDSLNKADNNKCMPRENQRLFSWDFYSKVVIVIFSLTQVLRWMILPRSTDIYYHLLTAWGFVQSGGYSGWDFWEYAPVGRVHIYPPFFHIVLAFLIKLGIDKIILAKISEAIMPILFLIALWYFIRKNYHSRLAFFVLITFSSTFSFYLSLMSYVPATLAMISGILVLGQLLEKKFLRPLVLLTLCFYTHIGIAWFFALCVLFYGLFNRELRRLSFTVFTLAIILSIPVIFKQLMALKLISISGINERFLFEFKTIDYILAILGLVIVFKMAKKYFLFLSLFLASLIFLPYPSKLVSGQGYLPIILLSAVFLDYLYATLQFKKGYGKKITYILFGFLLVISPTILVDRSKIIQSLGYKIYYFDSALMNVLLPNMNERIGVVNIPFSKEYLSAVELIKQNSQEKDIIYSSFNNVGVSLASISGRSTANALLSEIGPSERINPLSVSKIFIALKDESSQDLNLIMRKYNLVKLGENKLFIIYKNQNLTVSFKLRKPTLSFGLILLICCIFALIFSWANKIEAQLFKNPT